MGGGHSSPPPPPRHVNHYVYRDVPVDDPNTLRQISDLKAEINRKTNELESILQQESQKNRAINKLLNQMSGIQSEMSKLEHCTAQNHETVRKLQEGIKHLERQRDAVQAKYQNDKKQRLLEQGEVGNVSFGDIVGLNGYKNFVRAQLFNQTTEGLFAYGPPGCGKTYTAKAIANEGRFKYLVISGNDIVGDTDERTVEFFKNAFAVARKNVPCIMFFDEIEALVVGTDRRSQLLLGELNIQMDGLTSHNKGVMFVATTNKPYDIPLSIRRRFTSKLYFPLPNATLRRRFFERLFKMIPSNVNATDIGAFVEKTEGYSFRELDHVRSNMEVVKNHVGRQSSPSTPGRHSELNALHTQYAPYTQNTQSVCPDRKMVEWAIVVTGRKTRAEDVRMYERFTRECGEAVDDEDEDDDNDEDE